MVSFSAFYLSINQSTLHRRTVPGIGHDGSLACRYRDFLETVRERVSNRKSAGESLEQITNTLSPELASEFADLAPPTGSPAGRINAAIQAAFRLIQ